MARHKVKVEDAVVAIRLVEMSLRSCSNQSTVLNVLYESAPSDSQQDYLDYGNFLYETTYECKLNLKFLENKETELLEKLNLSHLCNAALENESLPMELDLVGSNSQKDDDDQDPDDEETFLCSWEDTQRGTDEVDKHEVQEADEDEFHLELENLDNFDTENSFDVLEGVPFDMNDDEFHDI